MTEALRLARLTDAVLGVQHTVGLCEAMVLNQMDR